MRAGGRPACSFVPPPPAARPVTDPEREGVTTLIGESVLPVEPALPGSQEPGGAVPIGAPRRASVCSSLLGALSGEGALPPGGVDPVPGGPPSSAATLMESDLPVSGVSIAERPPARAARARSCSAASPALSVGGGRRGGVVTMGWDPAAVRMTPRPASSSVDAPISEGETSCRPAGSPSTPVIAVEPAF